ncbi:hypothetical protein YK48G_09210 [Lentilactobacillus fungorum]|uniref:Uncharacterized protein n=1 Tax=Lentilactobacillus fungorum TaxID=2201250 RepID=A0ABQ3VZP1_9LACO|nr:hypothetical protein YK48G_09210 [Lentilactobacillus fungorum]
MHVITPSSFYIYLNYNILRLKCKQKNEWGQAIRNRYYLINNEVFGVYKLKQFSVTNGWLGYFVKLSSSFLKFSGGVTLIGNYRGALPT